MMATFAELSGVALPRGAGVDSFSILPALLSRPPTGPVRTDSIHEQYGDKLALAYRQGDWKLLLPKGVFKVVNKTITPAKMTGIEGFELYDMKNDPAESKNLAALNPEKTKALFALLKANIERGSSHE
jgi:arylsulfatase A-like enzyme